MRILLIRGEPRTSPTVGMLSVAADDAVILRSQPAAPAARCVLSDRGPATSWRAAGRVGAGGLCVRSTRRPGAALSLHMASANSDVFYNNESEEESARRRWSRRGQQVFPSVPCRGKRLVCVGARWFYFAMLPSATAGTASWPANPDSHRSCPKLPLQINLNPDKVADCPRWKVSIHLVKSP